MRISVRASENLRLRWKDRSMRVSLYACMLGCMDGSMDGWMDGWTDGWGDPYMQAPGGGLARPRGDVERGGDFRSHPPKGSLF